MFCTNCGSGLPSGSKFCSDCGTPATEPMTQPLSAQPTAAAPPTMAPPAMPPPTMPPPAMPPPASTPAPAGLPPIRLDLTRLLAGNWTGSALVALTMLVTAGVLSLVLALMAKPDDFGIDNSLTGVMMIMAGIFGADSFINGEFEGESFEVSAYTSSFPLTATIITFAVGVLAFRRMVRSYPSVLPALGDAVRVAVFVAVPLFVGSLVFRSDLEELGGGWISDAAAEAEGGDSATWGASAPSALFVGFGLVVFVLGLTCLARRDWWPGRSKPVAEWVAPAIQGVALMAALLPLCGLIGLALIGFGPDNDNDLHETTTDEKWAAIATIAGGLGNGGQALLGLGSGAELGAAGEFEGEGEFSSEDQSDEEFHRLAWFAGDQGEEPALWAAPAVLLAVLLGCAAWVASRSREISDVLRNLAVWCALLLIAVPWLTRLANLHGAGTLEYDGDEADFSGYVGLAGGEATFYIFLIAIAAALVVAMLRGALGGAQLRAALGRFQLNPAAGTPPLPPPPAYPPPPPPPPYDGR